MEVMIDTSEEVTNAVLEPENVIEEVVQNIRTLLATFKGTVPLDRGFGLSMDIMDLPPGRAAARLQIEIIEAIQDYEPRAEVVSIDFAGDIADGMLVPRVVVRIV